ncbi:MAG: PilC/PilY family type IV pilus protein [Pseudomonadota bacterium]|nr:PilC/PilY family type IV pilus protein [Pseudomonadota bacterium]
MKIPFKVSLLLLVAIGLAPTSLYADDTEIYYSEASADSNENRPLANVMVLLDTSGSMRWCENSVSNVGWCSDPDNRRINMLEEAMHVLIDSVPADVRMGLGRFRSGSSNAGHLLIPVTEINPKTKRVFKDAVSALNSAGESASGPDDPEGGTPTASAYWEMSRYMVGDWPYKARYGNDSDDDNTRSVCLEYEETETCEDVPNYDWVALPEGQQCYTGNWYCERECTEWRRRGRWGGWYCESYQYQEYQLVGTREECELTTTCLHDEPIVDGSGRYISPVNEANECETNHLVIFTDGEPNGGSWPSVCDRAPNSYACQVKISNDLYNDDNIVTYNVGLHMGDNLSSMEKVSTDGADGTYTASDAESLAGAFLEIFDLIDNRSRSIAAPGVAINQMNRFQHLDQLYYSVFEPSAGSYWEGNLKRYKLEKGVIKGQDGNNAVDPDTGYFKEFSQSFWSDETDGDDAKLGGAREEVVDRTLFYTNSAGNTRKLDWNNPALSKEEVGLNASAPDENYDALMGELKTMWGDPLHSVPLMVNYGGNSDNNVVFVSNNGGMLHAIDTSDGSEKFAFMPYEMISKANQYTIEREGLKNGNERQTYGLDGSWVAWRRPGDTADAAPSDVFLYGGMRRGGRHYYALDVGNPNSPSLKWKITGGSGDFDDLGQTWSTPTLTQIPVGDDVLPVLIFGGGYDPAGHDRKQGDARNNGDAMGNAIYIVNAETGALVWSASNTGADTNNSNMKWSVPGSISVVDKEFDGVADFLYFGDLGGQLFRVDIDQSGDKDMKVHRLASLGGSGASGNRRFYEAPAVAYLNDNGTKTLYVAAASGYRSHPLDENIKDGIFVVKDKTALAGTGAAPKDVALGDMTDVGSGKPQDDAMGWYYFLEEGEKSLASPVVFNNVLRFTTYEPKQEEDEENACAVTYGQAFLHTVSLETAEPVPITNDGTIPSDRREQLEQSTPPPTPVLVTDGEGNVNVVVGTEVIGAEDLGYEHLRKRRWYQMDKTQANEFKSVEKE